MCLRSFVFCSRFLSAIQCLLVFMLWSNLYCTHAYDASEVIMQISFLHQIQFLCIIFLQTFARMNSWHFTTNIKNSGAVRLII